MGHLFASFDDAWEYFLARTEPLEWFFGDFPDDEEFVAEGWIIEPPREIKQAGLKIQEAFAHLPWVSPVPEHFLHVGLGGAVSLAGRPEELQNSGVFEALYRRVNCFHSAVVIEVEAPRLHEFIAGTQVDVLTFLPHMTIGVTREQHDPEQLRRSLLPLRNARLGVGEVTELKHIRFPAAQTTLLRPWSVLRTLSLDK